MQVLEVRNAELIESPTRQAAEHGITDAAIVALIGAADSFTVSTPPSCAHAYMIPSEQHIALHANDAVVLEYFAGDGPPGRGRVIDQRVPLL